MAYGSEGTTGIGARTPEELETLLEDAAVLNDGDAMDGLFEPDAVLLDAGGRMVRGHAIGGVGHEAGVSRLGSGYYADPRTILQVREIALVVSPQAINVMRRGGDGSWRFLICCFEI